MDFRILLYLSMMFYIVHCSSHTDSNEEELRRQLKNLKSKVQAITSDVKRFAVELQFTGNSELTVPTRKCKRNVHTIIQTTVLQIDKDVTEALKKGKNEMKVGNCIKQVKTLLSSVRDNKDKALDKCRADAVTVAVAEIDSLEPVDDRGVQLSDQLNSVVSQCQSTSLYHVQKCIGARIRELHKDIGVFSTDALKQKDKVRSNFNNVLTTLKKCNSDTVNSAHVEIGKVKHDVDVCLQRA